jgi:predicted nucleotidyltransferase
MQPLSEYSESIEKLCAQHYVSSLSVFGSVLTDSFNEETDIDLAVNFEGVPLLDYFNNFMSFKESLETLLGRKVDLIENKAVRNPIFRKILDRDMRIVYERTAA